MTEPKKRRVSAKGAREKGLQFERDLIAYLGPALGLTLARGVAGAQAFDQAKGSSDLFGLPDLAVEAKRTEKFLLNEFMAQAVRNANNDMPVIIHRQSRQKIEDATVAIRLKDFVRIYHGYLTSQGIEADDPSP